MRTSLSWGLWTLSLCSAVTVGACSDDTSDDATSSGGGGATTSGSNSTTSAQGGMGMGGMGVGGAATTGTTTGSTTTSSTNSTGVGGAGCGSLPIITDAPMYLSDAGLYSDITTETIAPYAREFTPQFPLWTDDAAKRRWIYIPECEIIDTADMDTWQMPVGTRLWKEFVRDGIKVETRLLYRWGPGITDFKFAAYQWQGDDAVRVPAGAVDVNGTGHDIPPEALCSSCHRKDWRVLGFGAIQLSHAASATTIASLSADGLLSNPLPGGLTVPGNPTEQAALGYLHSNCGSCHYDGGIPSISMHFKLKSTDTTVMTTDTYTTSVNVQATQFQCSGCDRIEPGDAAASAVYQRMSIRGGQQMPPYATEVVDNVGSTAVQTWINSL